MRIEQLTLLESQEYDLLVIGGGATGAGIALDAALRGAKTALIDAQDFASGTSSRSTKLIHGGVRYLERAIFGLDLQQARMVRDLLQERAIILRIAPHLVHPLPIVLPFFSITDVLYYWPGIKLYDLLAGKRAIGRSSYVSSDFIRRIFPQIHCPRMRGGVLYFDGQFDDARMNIALIQTAIERGAVAVNYVEAVGFDKKNGKIAAVEAVDKFSGRKVEVRAKVFLNAAGPFADAVRKLDDPLAEPRLIASVGSHLVLDKAFAPRETGLLLPKTSDGRVLFLLPWHGRTLVGTTDVQGEIRRDPKPSEGEIGYLLDHLRRHLGIAVERNNIKAAWAGIRALLRPTPGKTTAEASRDFLTERSASGLFTVFGGKWSSYRKMAETVLDTIDKKGDLKFSTPCKTKKTPVVGSLVHDLSEIFKRLTREYYLDAERAQHLVSSYGDRAEKVAAEAMASGLSDRLVEGFPYLTGEVVYAIREEMAQTCLDVLWRRLPLAALDQNAAVRAFPKVLALMAKELQWSHERQISEKENAMRGIKNLPALEEASVSLEN